MAESTRGLPFAERIGCRGRFPGREAMSAHGGEGEGIVLKYSNGLADRRGIAIGVTVRGGSPEWGTKKDTYEDEQEV